MDDIAKISESLDKSNLSVDGTSEAVNHGIKKQKSRFVPAMMEPMTISLIAPISSLLIQPVASSLINATSSERWKGTR